MDKSAFKTDTRYAVTWRESTSRLRPANLYIYRLYEKFMIARMTDQGGLLHKIPYEDIVKIVMEIPVAKQDQFYIPAAVLDEKTWKDRTTMERYSSSPHMGK